MKMKQIIWNYCEVQTMNNLAVLPIILPLIAGFIIAFTNKKPTVSRFLSKIFIVINLMSVIYITYIIFNGNPIILETGSWEAPYGIIFVADSLSIVLVLTTNILALRSEERRVGKDSRCLMVTRGGCEVIDMDDS